MSTAQPMIEVLVKYSAGSYVTQTVRGKRASSTATAGQAVLRLRKKLHGAEGECTLIESMHNGVSLWQMAAPTATTSEGAKP